MNGPKKDANKIREFLKQLRQEPWLGPSRQWWPSYLFHFTDITNAVKILESGKLVCRNKGQIATDIASAQVIGQTADQWKDHVRLYFRPRTPTQYQNEGIRPSSNRGPLQAHCPVPVFFLFDAESVLIEQGTKFSDGNLASMSAMVGSDAEFLASIPFQKVFHDSWLSDSEKRNTIYHRHAEVLIPDELNLRSLRYLVCRSEAEVRTLNHLLSPLLWDKYSNLTKVGRPLFFRRWTFVEKTDLNENLVKIGFNPSTCSPGPFHARLDIHIIRDGANLYWEDPEYLADSELRVQISQIAKSVPYNVKFTLDGSLAYGDCFLAVHDSF